VISPQRPLWVEQRPLRAFQVSEFALLGGIRSALSKFCSPITAPHAVAQRRAFSAVVSSHLIGRAIAQQRLSWKYRLRTSATDAGSAHCTGGELKTVAIKDLRPTQFTHGLREVCRKTQFYQSLFGHDLVMAIAEKPVPFVLGPGGSPFAIDHHHVAAALRRAGIKTMPAVLVADFSSLSFQEFWLSMEDRRWTYPYDATGRRISFADMPDRVSEMEDDEYRSLAASVRDAGGSKRPPFRLRSSGGQTCFAAICHTLALTTNTSP
jgi:hypothetical protein